MAGCMNKYRNIIVLVLLTAFLGMISSCKSTRTTLKRPLKEYGFNYLYSKMLENQLEFNYLNAKFSIQYQQGRKVTNLRGQLRIKKDSITWISFSPALGIEAARIMMTNDSVKFINRLNKTYFTGQYHLLAEILNTTIDYSILQSMIIGNDLTQYDVNKYKASIDGGLYRITILERKKLKKFLRKSEDNPKVLIQNIWLDPSLFKIKRVELKELGEDNKKLVVIYDDYVEIDGKYFPKHLLINISSQKPITIDVDFQKIEMDNSLKFPFTISKKYKELELTNNPDEK